MRTSKPSLTDEIQRLATVDHLRRLVEEDAGPPVGGSRRWRCPIHDGDDPNFAVYRSEAGQPRWRCHSRCDKSGSLIDYLVMARGLSTKDAVHAQAMGQRLHYHMSGYTNKEIAERADITENALSRLMRGEAWGTLPVVVRLEQALGADLWCGKHD